MFSTCPIRLLGGLFGELSRIVRTASFVPFSDQHYQSFIFIII